MSAMFGVFHRQGGFAERSVLSTLSRLQQETTSYCCSFGFYGACGLGEQRLRSEKPDVRGVEADPESGLTIVCDARLDDRSSLSRKLGLGQVTGHYLSASELILLAFRKWGSKCVEHLLGDFVFAIWDPREQSLFCARDHTGARPFYYYFSPELFLFASSARAIAAVDSICTPIDHGRVADLLVGNLERINETSSFFENVSRLAPATSLLVSSNDIGIKRYWNLDPSKELMCRDDNEYADAFQAVLSKAISDRIPETGRVSSMLSGGLDSSSIVGIARDILSRDDRQPLVTFSGVSDEASNENPCQETHYVNAMVAHGGLDAFRLSPGMVAVFQEELNAIERAVEDPFDFGWVLHQLIYSSAARKGCRFIFNGVDGDVAASLTGAYPAYLARIGQFKSALHELRLQHVHYFDCRLKLKTVGRTFVKPFVPLPIRVRAFLSGMHLRRYVNEGLADSFLSPEFAADINLESRYAEWLGPRGYWLKESLRHEHLERIVTPDLTAGVERYERLAWGSGVRNLQPLLDRRVLEFCLSLPWDQKCRDGWSKYALRKVAERVVPKDVAWRPGWDQIVWKFVWALRALTVKQDVELILDHSDFLRDYVDWPKLEQYSLNRRNGSESYSMAEGRVLGLIHWQNQISNLPL